MSTPPPSEGLTLAAVATIVETRILVDTVEIFRPGPQILNPDTGVYEPGPDLVLYQGTGAVFSQGGPGLVLSLEGQAYADDTRNRYRLLTPLGAPLGSRDDHVRVTVATQDPGLLNRTWRVLDISDANSLAVVRTTWLDESTQTTGA
ncbi:DUF6093 family protein [Streptomyces rhizosphaerihabitans]|uniref:DUF6093 family protein n=1 Tax=Streptomyces rhizosphaerihabitans TaxID=1266770 RepID=UPI0021BF66CB|nr:DUF6093 family protein [Streptomyces rhizosphaerihabitans]MCT9003541.1 DUF6093 family protein [Streptomyces rhizosphaerihabitans]